MPVSTDDYVAISDHLARYCWCVDEGDEDGWVALWTEDAVFVGVGPEPLVGREALRGVVQQVRASAGMMRHMVANLACDYQDGKDIVLARYYNFVSTWAPSPQMTVMALSKVVLERQGGGWLIRRSDTTMLAG